MPRSGSTITPLGGAQSVTIDITPGLADKITGAVFADQAGTIFIEQSGNNTNWDVSTNYAVTASAGKGFSEEILLPYVRVRYLNGASAQTIFRLFTRVTAAGPR